ncbi:MAG: hypothetical protein GXO22_01090 [Aquificae bacterium]|nr:hypothetical protein [Aquificota bacterium]
MWKWFLRKVLLITLIFLIFLFVLTLLFMMGSIPSQKVVQIVGEFLGSIIISNPLLASGLLFVFMIVVSILLKQLKNL